MKSAVIRTAFLVDSEISGFWSDSMVRLAGSLGSGVGSEPEDFDASSREIAQVGEPTLVRNRR